MDIDITDSIFSLANVSAINNIVSESTIAETIVDSVKEIIPDSIIPESIPDVFPSEMVNNVFQGGDLLQGGHLFQGGSVEGTAGNDSFIYIGIGIFVVLAAIFAYNYYSQRNKKVSFNDTNEVCYPDNESFCRRSEF